MSFFPKLYFLGSVGIFILGVWGVSNTNSEVVAPPKLTLSKSAIEKSERPPVVSSASLSLPWILPEVSFKSKLPEVVTTPVDKTSLVFLGSYKDSHAQSSYFFKQKSTGQIIILYLGQKNQGWSLETVGENSFTLAGPGGRYEVLR